MKERRSRDSFLEWVAFDLGLAKRGEGKGPPGQRLKSVAPCTLVLGTRAGLGLLESGELCTGLPHLRGTREEGG